MKAYFYAMSERIRRGEAIPLPLAVALHALTPCTRLGMALRKRRNRVRVPVRVISFGNLTTGGVGKTPAVIERAQREAARGRRVAVLTRGYGSQKTAEPHVVAPGTFRPELMPQIGDEPALILRRVPEVGLVKAADRVAGAQAAIAQLDADTLILDDGYQALYLERDENILLLDAQQPFGNGHLLPRGILREPVTALERATEIVLTRCDQGTADAVTALRDWLQERVHVPVRCTCHVPTGLWELGSGQTHGLDWLQGRTVVALCGIARPEAFFSTLESLGAQIRDWTVLPDHGAISADCLRRANWIVTTEKDAMRLPADVDRVMALAIELRDWPIA